MAESKDHTPSTSEPQPKSRSSGFMRIDKKALDPTLASLFATSAGPVEAPPKSRYQNRMQRKIDEELSELEEAGESDDDDNDEEEEDDSTATGSDSQLSGDEEKSTETEQSESDVEATVASIKESMFNGAKDKSKKKRKRGDEEEIEDTYLRKLACEEEKEEEQRQKKRKTEKALKKAKENIGSDTEEEAEKNAEPDLTIPKHEVLTQTDRNEVEVEKASRTVFLANVSTECINSKSAEKILKRHLESFTSDLADNNPPHKIESVRYRSIAFDNSLPKRAAFAKKEIMESTTRSTNAYAVYSTKVAAREAVKRLNGSVLLKRHLHVDSVAHPAKVDHRRCVFVGNLPFVDDSQIPDGEAKKKNKLASDVEEGLWAHFAKAGEIESVRIVRDAATRVGKGFAYVQFCDENAVEAALQFNEQKFPPMLPRKLRVTRCKAEKKTNKDKPRAPPLSAEKRTTKARYVAKLTAEEKSLQGRAQSMLGKVAKAHSKEGFVFEGHRAKAGQAKSGLKFKTSSKKKGPNGRKSRSAAWKKNR